VADPWVADWSGEAAGLAAVGPSAAAASVALALALAALASGPVDRSVAALWLPSPAVWQVQRWVVPWQRRSAARRPCPPFQA
jgi:hypothetical protein